MVQHQRSILLCSLIVLIFIEWVNSGTICVSTGDTRQLFSKSDTSNICKDVFLYVNGEKNLILISSWQWDNGIFQDVYQKPEYKRKIVVDRNGNIFILNVLLSDAGRYIIQCDDQKYVTQVEVKFSEDLMECQNDTTFMKKLGENSNKEELRAMNNHLEAMHKIIGGMIIAIVIGIVLALILPVIIWCYLDRQYKNKYLMKEEMEPLLHTNMEDLKKLVETIREGQVISIREIYQLWTECFEKLREDQKLQFQENCRQWMEHFDTFKEEPSIFLPESENPWQKQLGKLKLEQILKLLNHQQQEDLKSYCNKLTFEKIRELEVKKHGETCNFAANTSTPIMEQGAEDNSSPALVDGPVIDMNESKDTFQKILGPKEQ